MGRSKDKALQSVASLSLPREKNMVCYRAQKLDEGKELCNGPIRKKNNACYRAHKKGEKKMLYNKKAFGIVISTLRVQKGLTQESLSGLAGIARSHLAALEKGEKTAKLDTVWRIADALGIPPSELIRKTERQCRVEK